MTRAAAITFYGMAALVPFMGLVIALVAHGLPWARERSRATFRSSRWRPARVAAAGSRRFP